MKNLPKFIYLQVDADGETPEDFNDLSEVSWCAQRIHENDIKYRLTIDNKPAPPIKETPKEVCTVCGRDEDAVQIWIGGGPVICDQCRTN